MPQNLQSMSGVGINGDHRVYSNFFSDNYIIQQACITQPKNLMIDVLRKHFSRDNIFTYRADEYGFPLTPDRTGLEFDSELTTKILISDSYRYEVKFFPAIIISSNGGTYKPISFNQNATIKYRKSVVEDDYGIRREVSVPTHRVYAGAWDMNFDVKIYSESHSELEELVEIVAMIFQHVSWHELNQNGLFVKNISIGAESAEPYANDYVFNQTISIPVRTEWRVEIPIESLVEKIVFYFDSVRTPVVPNGVNSDKLELRFDDVIEFAEVEL